MSQQIKPCQRCAKTDGWFEKRVTAWRQYYDEAGEPTHIAEDRRIRGGVRKFCINCNADITNKIK